MNFTEQSILNVYIYYVIVGTSPVIHYSDVPFAWDHTQ